MAISTMLGSISCCPSPKGYEVAKQHSGRLNQCVFTVRACVPVYCEGVLRNKLHSFGGRGLFERRVFLDTSRRLYFRGRWSESSGRRVETYAGVDVASAVDVINDLGFDTLTFLMVTVIIVPAFRVLKASPILGFFFAGVVLNQFGFIRNLTDVKVLSEWGILFLLFEMGLELSLARLKALAKFAFGMGLSQVLLCTLAFTAFELPPNGAIGTRILEFLFHSRPDLVNIRSIDEAIVIGAALSLSSSAFVLQLLAEKGELPTRFGSATLGILLLQDIAVVPLLVVLPVLESQNLVGESILPMLAKESAKALGGLGILSLGGKFLLRRIFEVVAETRSSEAFVALCLLTVAGTSLLTQKLGFSDTLGAFLAGALLAETNFRTQIEADIRPFRGLLLGLFFVTTGTSIDMEVLFREWPNVLTLLAGLIVIKTLIITALGPRVGLTLQESVRIGFLLSQGGEFAFVVFSLANRLGVLPLELNKLLIIVVVLSMALTPTLNQLGRSRHILNPKPTTLLHKTRQGGLVNTGFNVCPEVTKQTHKENRKVYVREQIKTFISTAELMKKFQTSTHVKASLPQNRTNKLTLTRPKEPEFVTSQRARPLRVKSSAELEEEMLAKIPKFKARPVNKKILAAPALPAPQRSTPHLPEFQEFHLETMARANQLAETSSIASTQVSKQHNDWKPHLTAPKPPVLQTMLRARPTKAKTTAELEQEELDKAPKFKAKPLNKKIFESKGEMGIFCNTKKHITIPQEFHFATDERISKPNSVLDAFDKLSLTSESCHEKPLPRITAPSPFNLRTEERGAEKEKKFVMEVTEKLIGDERARVPKATPYPYTTDYPVVPPKPEPKQCTKPEPFQLEGLVRHEDEVRREMEERMRMEREEAQKRLFKAQPVIKEDPIPVPEKVRKPLTEIQAFDLHVEHRAVGRADFDQKVNEKENQYKRYREESEAAKMVEEERYLKQMRKTMVPHARPVPNFNKPFVPQKSNKETTKPKSPKLRVIKRTERRKMTARPVSAATSASAGQMR